jgi:hypothetical protein
MFGVAGRTPPLPPRDVTPPAAGSPVPCMGGGTWAAAGALPSAVGSAPTRAVSSIEPWRRGRAGICVFTLDTVRARVMPGLGWDADSLPLVVAAAVVVGAAEVWAGAAALVGLVLASPGSLATPPSAPASPVAPTVPAPAVPIDRIKARQIVPAS